MIWCRARCRCFSSAPRQVDGRDGLAGLQARVEAAFGDAVTRLDDRYRAGAHGPPAAEQSRVAGHGNGDERTRRGTRHVDHRERKHRPYNQQGETFTDWLAIQKDREGLVGQLIAGMKADRRFPRNGDPEAVRKHLSVMQADGDMFEAVDEAKTDWLAY